MPNQNKETVSARVMRPAPVRLAEMEAAAEAELAGWLLVGPNERYTSAEAKSKLADVSSMSAITRQHGWSKDKVARLRKPRWYYRAVEQKEEQA